MRCRLRIDSGVLSPVKHSMITRMTTCCGRVLNGNSKSSANRSRLDKLDSETAAAIPELARIVAFRNLLIHGYATVDDRIVWGVVEGNLSKLREVLQRLLDSP